MERDARGALFPADLASVRFRRRLSRAEAKRIDVWTERAVRATPASEALRAAALRRYAGRLAFYETETVIQR